MLVLGLFYEGALRAHLEFFKPQQPFRLLISLYSSHTLHTLCGKCAMLHNLGIQP